MLWTWRKWILKTLLGLLTNDPSNSIITLQTSKNITPTIEAHLGQLINFIKENHSSSEYPKEYQGGLLQDNEQSNEENHVEDTYPKTYINIHWDIPDFDD